MVLNKLWLCSSGIHSLENTKGSFTDNKTPRGWSCSIWIELKDISFNDCIFQLLRRRSTCYWCPSKDQLQSSWASIWGKLRWSCCCCCWWWFYCFALLLLVVILLCLLMVLLVVMVRTKKLLMREEIALKYGGNGGEPQKGCPVINQSSEKNPLMEQTI